MQAMIQAHFTLFGCAKREGDWYIAHCPPLDLSSQGRTIGEAKENLMEAAEFFFISCIERGTLDQALKELGFVKVGEWNRGVPHNAFKMVIPIPMRFQKSDPCLA